MRPVYSTAVYCHSTLLWHLPGTACGANCQVWRAHFHPMGRGTQVSKKFGQEYVRIQTDATRQFVAGRVVIREQAVPEDLE